MRVDVLTIFPEICGAPLQHSIMKRAQEAGHLELHLHDLRDWTTDRHRKVDDLPYGGGPGMVMKPEPFFAAVRELRRPETRVLLMTPQGRPFRQSDAVMLSGFPHLLILCGHYEGIDHRVVEALVDEEWSIGDYVLTNGAIAAAVLIDAVTRLIPGVLGDEGSSQHESFTDPKLVEAPHYTRPAEFEGRLVPEVLLSGDHAAIEAWRARMAKERTIQNRPDL